jgi:hypothetical protein
MGGDVWAHRNWTIHSIKALASVFWNMVVGSSKKDLVLFMIDLLSFSSYKGHGQVMVHQYHFPSLPPLSLMPFLFPVL